MHKEITNEEITKRFNKYFNKKFLCYIDKLNKDGIQLYPFLSSSDIENIKYAIGILSNGSVRLSSMLIKEINDDSYVINKQLENDLQDDIFRLYFKLNEIEKYIEYLYDIEKKYKLSWCNYKEDPHFSEYLLPIYIVLYIEYLQNKDDIKLRYEKYIKENKLNKLKQIKIK